METKIDKEGVHTIYQEGKLVGIIKRDDPTGHHLVYLTSLGTSEDIADLLKIKKTNEVILTPAGDNK